MAKVKEVEVKVTKESNWKGKNGQMGGGVYGLGLIGALIYYLQHAQTFTEGVVGVLKAFFWPAFLVYKLLEVLKF